MPTRASQETLPKAPVEHSPATHTEVALDKSFEDPDMGDEIEIISTVRNFESTDQTDLIDSGDKVVLLKVKATPGDEFGGFISTRDFEIPYDGGADYWNNLARSVEDEMEDAGFTPFEDVCSRDGKAQEGRIALLLDEKAGTYQVQYLRGAEEVIGIGERNEELEKTIDIPCSLNPECSSPGSQCGPGLEGYLAGSERAGRRSRPTLAMRLRPRQSTHRSPAGPDPSYCCVRAFQLATSDSASCAATPV